MKNQFLPCFVKGYSAISLRFARPSEEGQSMGRDSGLRQIAVGIVESSVKTNLGFHISARLSCRP